MRKLLSLLLLLALGLSCCAFAAEDTLTGVPQDEITAQWGSPEKLLNYTVGIWKRDGQTLAATFVTDPETQQLLVQDYVILDSERQLLAGTIPTEDTLFHVYDVVSSTAAAEIPGVVDVGSGAEIHAKITADGYVVCWQRDCPNIFTDLYLTVYDGVKGQEDGLKTAYLAYVMAQEDADVPYTLDELLTYFAPDAAEMAEVSAHEAVQQVDLKQLPDEKKNIAALRECFPNAGASAEDAEDYPYLVYSLADGSRLFVFYAPDDGTMTMLVLLTARRDAADFAALAEGTHTYQEVLTLDANVQGNALGRGVATEHCASDGTYWQIWYRPDKEGWPVESVTQMQRDELMTILRYISPEDMPEA